MRTVWLTLGIAAAAALVLAGCKTTDPTRPPKPPEEYTVPPAEDARYSQPPRFPKGTLNAERVPVAAPAGLNSPGMNPRGPRPGGGPGAGNY
jgi:hypothetical protein